MLNCNIHIPKAKPDRRKSLGLLGEDYAAEFLQYSGYKIEDRNVRPLPGLARGEIDIIAWDCSILCFIEVKTRASSSGATPESSVGTAKRKQLITLAEAYLSVKNIEPESCRFDVVSVWIDPKTPTPMVTLLKNAFLPE
jgi:putative endonuclease